ncbi:MAG: hypothetical protein JWM11_5726, partial [Planctomycetaceae bacterium]|nr:hypothetical protein [Planctomycetaceae bacterium]
LPGQAGQFVDFPLGQGHQPAHVFEVFAASGGEETVVADLLKTRRQHMLQEPPQELEPADPTRWH